MPRNAAPIKVLLVDDHEHVLLGLRKLIEGEWPRMTVTGVARTIAQALATVHNCSPDVIVLDIQLGAHSAIGGIPALACGGAQVLILTGQSAPALHEQAIANGARVVVMKHDPADVLLREIERIHESRDAGTVGAFRPATASSASLLCTNGAADKDVPA